MPCGRTSSARHALRARSSRSAARGPGALIEVEAVALSHERRVQRVITEVEPAGATGPAARPAPARQGPDRHRGDPHDLRVEDLRRPRAGRALRRRSSASSQAGAVVVGKANLHEFAWGVTSQNPWYGTVQNPRLPGRTTGGSSGATRPRSPPGSCDLGLGTDTGCSIRLPASCCGVVGLKPSWGRIPIDGVFPLCPTLRHCRADGDDGRRRRARCGRCSPASRCPQPRLAA